MEQAKRSYQLARDDYDKANRLLLLELPQFYEKRVDYFQPSLQVEKLSKLKFFPFHNHSHPGSNTSSS